MGMPSIVSTVVLAFVMASAFPANVSAQQKNGSVVVAVTQATATVEDIDKDNRILTLKGPEGRVFDVKVGDRVENFDQISKGDEVSVEYLQSVALRLSNEPAPASEFAQFSEVAPAGERPAAVKAATLQLAATIENIDTEKREVTVRGPKGKTMVLTADSDVNLDRLNEGDQILVTYTEAVALSLKKSS